MLLVLLGLGNMVKAAVYIASRYKKKEYIQTDIRLAQSLLDAPSRAESAPPLGSVPFSLGDHQG